MDHVTLRLPSTFRGLSLIIPLPALMSTTNTTYHVLVEAILEVFDFTSSQVVSCGQLLEEIFENASVKVFRLSSINYG